MPVFPKPGTRYAYDVEAERKHLSDHKAVRGIPGKGRNRLLLGSWNIANFGAQLRRECDLRLLAEVLGWFDVIALQECRENFGDLYNMVGYMGPQYRVVMSDAGGNNERLVFIFDGKKLAELDEIGEICFPPSRAGTVSMRGVRQRFAGFDRNPYLASFELVGTPLGVQLVNVHLFYGSEGAKDMDRRTLETVAVARWTALRSKSQYGGARELIALGDFNMPKPRRDGSNEVLGALRNGGLVIPPHSSEIGSSIASDNHYDQVAMLPTTTRAWLVQVGVFDYDAVVFPDLWKSRGEAAFKRYLRYYLSDHRPMWVELRPK